MPASCSTYAARIPDDDYPWAPGPAERRAWMDRLEAEWGGPVDLADFAPSVVDDERFVAWWSRYLRASAAPRAAVALAEMPSRVLATVVFTDIVSSTERAEALGDERWRALLDRHDQLVRTEIKRFGGRVVKHTGDGFLATFDGPGRAGVAHRQGPGDRVRHRVPEPG